MAQPNAPKKLSKKAAQEQAELSPSWMPDARWHLKTLAVIYAALIVLYFGISRLLGLLPKPYQLRVIPPEMTPWLAPGGKAHLPEDELRAPDSPTLPPQEKRAAPTAGK